jgi:hypothetical protein
VEAWNTIAGEVPGKSNSNVAKGVKSPAVNVTNEFAVAVTTVRDGACVPTPVALITNGGGVSGTGGGMVIGNTNC